MTEAELITPVTPDIPAPYHKGIPIGKLVELSAKGLTSRQIGKIVGCCHTNVSTRLKAVAPVLQRAEDFPNLRVTQLRYLQSLCLEHITPDKCEKARLVELSTTFGTLYDKERLELDKPDSINGIQLRWQDADRELPDDLAGRKQRLIGDNEADNDG